MTGSIRAGTQRETPLGEHARAARLQGPLKWGLLATLLATVASLVWPTHAVVDTRGRSDGAPLAGEAPAAQSARATAAQPTLAASGSAVANLQPLQEASAASAVPSFDPFVGVVPTPPPAPVPIVQAVTVAAAPPAPPPQEYRFLGRVTGPDGVEQILLSRGESVVSIGAGTVLDNGYVVESIAADSVALKFPPLDARASISIPARQSGP